MKTRSAGAVAILVCLSGGPACVPHAAPFVAVPVEHRSAAETRYPTPDDTRSVQAVLRPDEIAVTFFLEEPHSSRWVMSQEHLVLDRIAGRGAIEQEVTRLRAFLRSPAAAPDANAVSARLGAMLFEGISTADDRPMVIVPHGALHQVPFEVLTLQKRMVIERHAVSYAPSLAALVQLRNTPGARAVAATLWKPDDRFTARFMPRLYTELNLGYTPGEALRRAKVAYLAHPEFSHPFYWSSVVLLGDGSRPLAARPPAHPQAQPLLALGLAVLAFVLALKQIFPAGRR